MTKIFIFKINLKNLKKTYLKYSQNFFLFFQKNDLGILEKVVD